MNGPIYHCEYCSKPIHSGELYCAFYTDEPLCVAHAVTRSEEIGLRKQSVEIGDWEARRGETNLPPLAYYEAYTAKLEAALAADGDGPVCMVTA